MTEIIQFLFNHWLLSSSFAILLILLIVNEFVSLSFSSNQLSTQQAVQMMNHHQAIFVDIRDPESFKRGHVVGAMNAPEKQASLLNKYKLKIIILACENGLLSPKLVKQLRAEGFEKIHFLMGGIQAWKKEGLPLVQK